VQLDAYNFTKYQAISDIISLDSLEKNEVMTIAKYICKNLVYAQYLTLQQVCTLFEL